MVRKPLVKLSPRQERALALREAMGRLHVLSIGVSDYSVVPGFHSLKTPENDARAVADCFRDVHQLNAARDTIAVLPSARRPSRGAILASVQALASAANTQDRLLFYFSGHGVRLSSDAQNTLYLVPEDAYSDDNPDALVSYQKVADILNQSAAKQKIVILDACHSGPDTKLLKVRAARFSHSALVKYVATTTGLVVLASSPDTKPSLAKSPNPSLSLMTHFLVAALRGAQDALDEDGHLTVSSLFDYVALSVQRQAATYQKVQHPVIEVRATGDIVLGDFSASIVDPTSFDVAAYPVTEVAFVQERRARVDDVLTAIKRRSYSAEYLSKRVNDVLPDHLEERLAKLVTSVRRALGLTVGTVAIDGAGLTFPGGDYSVIFAGEDETHGTMVHRVALEDEWFTRTADIPALLDCLGVVPEEMSMTLINTIKPETTVAGLEAKGWTITSERTGKVEARRGVGTVIVVEPDTISLTGFTPSEIFGSPGPKAALLAQTLTRLLTA